MKKTLSFLTMLIFGNTAISAQNVNIPDANFKTALVANPAINTNNDTEIQLTEAQAFTGTINVNIKNITDLTGIEAFTALTVLHCNYNQLTTLNISANTALTILDCQFNQLTALDISTNTALEQLYCRNNQLTALNTSTNTALTYLSCYNNQITTLDISTNTDLVTLWCSYNQLTALNLSNNTALATVKCQNNQLTTLNLSVNTALIVLECQNNLLTALNLSTNTALSVLRCQNNQLPALNLNTNIALSGLYCHNNQLTTLKLKNGNNTAISDFDFQAQDNPNLTCIEVDSIAFSNAFWNARDSGTYFSTDCSISNSITNLSDGIVELKAYPNPTNGKISINLGKTYNNAHVLVSNITGQMVFSKDYTAVNQVDLNLEGVSGVYFVKVKTEAGEAVLKVVVSHKK